MCYGSDVLHLHTYFVFSDTCLYCRELLLSIPMLIPRLNILLSMPLCAIIILLPAIMLQLHRVQQQQPWQRLLHLIVHCDLDYVSISCHFLQITSLPLVCPTPCQDCMISANSQDNGDTTLRWAQWAQWWAQWCRDVAKMVPDKNAAQTYAQSLGLIFG